MRVRKLAEYCKKKDAARVLLFVEFQKCDCLFFNFFLAVFHPSTPIVESNVRNAGNLGAVEISSSFLSKSATIPV